MTFHVPSDQVGRMSLGFLQQAATNKGKCALQEGLPSLCANLRFGLWETINDSLRAGWSPEQMFQVGYGAWGLSM
ncbi:MAG: hypothetical protein OXC63_00940 [Aestuariivita sp.]|nr:hypothetical protein [Aestuariivita sp.]MCY4345459.1 hypothetical protein [Aestuariivita sp.]